MFNSNQKKISDFAKDELYLVFLSSLCIEWLTNRLRGFVSSTKGNSNKIRIYTALSIAIWVVLAKAVSSGTLAGWGITKAYSNIGDTLEKLPQNNPLHHAQLGHSSLYVNIYFWIALGLNTFVCLCTRGPAIVKNCQLGEDLNRLGLEELFHKGDKLDKKSPKTRRIIGNIIAGLLTFILAPIVLLFYLTFKIIMFPLDLLTLLTPVSWSSTRKWHLFPFLRENWRRVKMYARKDYKYKRGGTTDPSERRVEKDEFVYRLDHMGRLIEIRGLVYNKATKTDEIIRYIANAETKKATPGKTTDVKWTKETYNPETGKWEGLDVIGPEKEIILQRLKINQEPQTNGEKQDGISTHLSDDVLTDVVNDFDEQSKRDVIQLFDVPLEDKARKWGALAYLLIGVPAGINAGWGAIVGLLGISFIAALMTGWAIMPLIILLVIGGYAALKAFLDFQASKMVTFFVRWKEFWIYDGWRHILLRDDEGNLIRDRYGRVARIRLRNFWHYLSCYTRRICIGITPAVVSVAGMGAFFWICNMLIVPKALLIASKFAAVILGHALLLPVLATNAPIIIAIAVTVTAFAALALLLSQGTSATSKFLYLSEKLLPSIRQKKAEVAEEQAKAVHTKPEATLDNPREGCVSKALRHPAVKWIVSGLGTLDGANYGLCVVAGGLGVFLVIAPHLGIPIATVLFASALALSIAFTVTELVKFVTKKASDYIEQLRNWIRNFKERASPEQDQNRQTKVENATLTKNDAAKRYSSNAGGMIKTSRCRPGSLFFRGSHVPGEHTGSGNEKRPWWRRLRFFGSTQRSDLYSGAPERCPAHRK